MKTETPEILSFDTKRRQHWLTPAQIETVQEGTLKLLKEVGVHFPSPRAQEIFSDFGADVDKSSNIVRIPPDLVEKAVLYPASLTISIRDSFLSP